MSWEIWQMQRNIFEDKVNDFREDLVDALEAEGQEQLAKEIDEMETEDLHEIAVFNHWLTSYAVREMLPKEEQ